MDEKTTDETTTDETSTFDVEAHRQPVRREFVPEPGDPGLGRRNPVTDRGEDVEAHMTRVPFGRRESVDGDEADDVRAHSPARASTAADGSQDVEAHMPRRAVGEGLQAEEEDADDVRAHADVVEGDTVDRGRRRL